MTESEWEKYKKIIRYHDSYCPYCNNKITKDDCHEDIDYVKWGKFNVLFHIECFNKIYKRG